ncbi:DegT/DnrJ/EryC1/StrS family aminotransferase [Streptomyces sp. NBC_00083]|uniref:DegT/DnrJ/EryC1/StrS family aminotransferase n=1 Tax=Streptomyces sp. NBC_00083 TaxID=2975647 RepID=UPI002252DB44|nr:DegT/DnrJ/EryC1/StrS family aminotransferase [Streptomyces sp. NBC_00083]MCX5386059.1 DegT/DnrJ/EryC1/StrS family aminotransferase [Streptomyces sp. NBC_00083]
MRMTGALTAAGVASGDEVIVPAYDTGELARAVVAAGAAPVFADIDPRTYCLSPDTVGRALTPRTAAVVLVRRFGYPADTASFAELTTAQGVLLVEEEDGEGLGGDVAQRRERARYLDRRLVGVATPAPADGHRYQRYVVRVPGNGRPDRDAFARLLKRRGVACEVPVPTPVHRMREFRRDEWVLHATERAADETLALPSLDALSPAELRRLVSVCNALGGLLQPA